MFSGIILPKEAIIIISGFCFIISSFHFWSLKLSTSKIFIPKFKAPFLIGEASILKCLPFGLSGIVITEEIKKRPSLDNFFKTGNPNSDELRKMRLILLFIYKKFKVQNVKLKTTA